MSCARRSERSRRPLPPPPLSGPHLRRNLAQRLAMTGPLGRKVETRLTGGGQRHGLGDAGVHGARGERPEAGWLGTERREPFYPRCFPPRPDSSPSHCSQTVRMLVRLCMDRTEPATTVGAGVCVLQCTGDAWLTWVVGGRWCGREDLSHCPTLYISIQVRDAA